MDRSPLKDPLEYPSMPHGATGYRCPSVSAEFVESLHVGPDSWTKDNRGTWKKLILKRQSECVYVFSGTASAQWWVLLWLNELCFVLCTVVREYLQMTAGFDLTQ